ncbi:MerR family transcriptional regulator [Streptomyces albofaciens JCM 4342]|uniref:MerR family transcriptional regulator n=1 Tax=Streptomyces albofaciens TaxID=66866 RepID=UPI00123C1D5A|nr:MerR family transcriptional regulator [Streptomyces albofaciens]KAA6223940.1 MerR family transcriptional regulator [Streptomyces albofaciens JCM 4342]
MAWPIAEVARMSGVTARTLRHYDDIGLLPPARVGANGHRYYEERQLLRLQQVLVLRALGLGLPEIGRILAAQVDELAALRGHHRRLLAERDRLDALAGTVARTITGLERSRKGGTDMIGISRPENLFEGIRSAQCMKVLHGFPELVGAVERHTAALSRAEAEADERERTAQLIRLAEQLAAGLPADADAVQAGIGAQYRTLARSRAATAEEYRAIGRCCVENAHWRAAYESIAPGLAAYQRAAIEAYAATRLR